MTVKHFKAHVVPFNSTRVDKANRRIYGSVAMEVGEARGHNFYADLKALEAVAQLANNRPTGITHMRFGHPGMSDEALGKMLGKSYNWRVEGSKLKHDVEFYEWARLTPDFDNDPVEYLLDRALDAPETFGESVVISLDKAWVLQDGSELPYEYMNEDGAETTMRPETSRYDYPVMRPTHLHFVDFVGEGALTPAGLFDASNPMNQLLQDTTGEYAQQIFTILDQMTDNFGLSGDELQNKAVTIIDRWKSTRGIMSQPAESTQETPVVPSTSLNDVIAQLQAMNTPVTPEPEIVDPVTPVDSSDVTELQAQVETLSAHVVALTSVNETLTTQFSELQTQVAQFSQLMMSQLSAVQAQVEAINNEEIASASVGGQAFANLRRLPTTKPSTALQAQKPKGFEQRVVKQKLADHTAQELLELGKEDPNKLSELMVSG